MSSTTTAVWHRSKGDEAGGPLRLAPGAYLARRYALRAAHPRPWSSDHVDTGRDASEWFGMKGSCPT